jgi:hypothetical protein
MINPRKVRGLQTPISILSVFPAFRTTPEYVDISRLAMEPLRPAWNFLGRSRDLAQFRQIAAPRGFLRRGDANASNTHQLTSIVGHLTESGVD